MIKHKSGDTAFEHHRSWQLSTMSFQVGHGLGLSFAVEASFEAIQSKLRPLGYEIEKQGSSRRPVEFRGDPPNINLRMEAGEVSFDVDIAVTRIQQSLRKDTHNHDIFRIK